MATIDAAGSVVKIPDCKETESTDLVSIEGEIMTDLIVVSHLDKF